MRLLFIEDNEDLSRLISGQLRSAGYTVDHFLTGTDGLHAIASSEYDGIVLDLGLPDMDGMDLLRHLRRQRNALPILILTARTSVSDKVEGLRSGADDYLAKPFATQELLARIEAILRRPHRLDEPDLAFANVSLDSRSKQLLIDGKPAILNAREFNVLELLLRRKGRVVAKETIEAQLFGLSGDGSPNAIEVYVYRLRKSLSDHGARLKINTVRGVGYFLVESARL